MYLLTDLPVRARGLFAAGIPAEVHSVYKSTVNLAVDGALFPSNAPHGAARPCPSARSFLQKSWPASESSAATRPFSPPMD